MKGAFTSLLQPDQQLYSQIGTGDHLHILLCRMIGITIVCGGLYGLSMGAFHSWMQALSSALRVPLLLFSTLAVTLPALHLFQLFLGGAFRFLQTLTMALVGTAVMSILLVGLVPVPLLFLLSSPNYAFLNILHVLIFSIAGGCGLIAVNRCRASQRSTTKKCRRELVGYQSMDGLVYVCRHTIGLSPFSVHWSFGYAIRNNAAFRQFDCARLPVGS